MGRCICCHWKYFHPLELCVNKSSQHELNIKDNLGIPKGVKEQKYSSADGGNIVRIALFSMYNLIIGLHTELLFNCFFVVVPG